MSVEKQQYVRGIILRPDSVALNSVEGEFKVDSGDNKFKAYLGAAIRSIVTEDQSQTLTNKSIDADNNTISNLEVDNLKSGVLDTDLSAVSGSHDTLPSAKAVKDYVDAQIDTVDQASEISFNNVSSGLTASNVQSALDEIDVDIDDLNTLSGVAKNAQNLGTFTGATIADSSTIKASLQSLETSLENKSESSVVSEIDANVDDLITLSGVAENSSSLGTFTGATIPDSSTVKAALQSLETSLEEIDQNANDLISLSGVAENATTLGTFTGTTIADSSTVKAALQDIETAHEAHLSDSVDAHDASAISSVASGNLVATDVQAALNELQTDIDTRATSSALTTHTGASTGVHGVTGSVVGTSDSQTLTNKTISTSKIGGGTASATNKTLVSKDTYSNLNSLAREEASVYFATDAKKLYVDDGSSLLSIGSGQGGINYIDNPDFEVNTTGWNLFDDGVAVPVDGTGGTVTSTFVRSTSSPLRDTASGLFSKAASVSYIGEGFSYDFSIDSADKAKVLEISFDYETTVNFVDGYARCYIYDVTNALIIEPSQRDILANAGQAKYGGFFQAASDSTSYRLIVNIATATTTAWDLKIDNVKVGPPALSQGAFSSVSSLISSSATQSLTTATDTKVTFSTVDFDSAGMSDIGNNRIYANESGFYNITCQLGMAANATGLRMTMFYKNGALITPGNYGRNITVPSSAFNTEFNHSIVVKLDKGDYIELYARQESGGALNVVRAYLNLTLLKSDSSSISNSIVAARYTRSAALSLTGAAYTVVPYTIKSFDTTLSYNTGTGGYTVPESGKYRFTASLRVNAVNASASIFPGFSKNGTTSGDYVSLNQFKNYDAGTANNMSVMICDTYDLVKGDTIYVLVYSDNTESIETDVLYNTFTVEKLNSSSPYIAPIETVSAKYTTNNGDPVANNTGFVINYEDKSYDTHSAVTTGAGVWKFTAPIAGKYLVQARAMLAVATGWEISESVFAYIYVNGTNVSRKVFYLPTSDTSATSWSITVDISDTVDLVKGDYVDIRLLQDSDASINMVSTTVYNTVCIDKIG